MEFCSNVVESDDYVAMRFSLSTLLYTQNGLNLFLLLQHKRSWRKKKMLVRNILLIATLIGVVGVKKWTKTLFLIP